MKEPRHKGKLFILVGPSGTGKGTLRERALSDVNRLIYSISCTTREPRNGEREGIDYRFVTKQDFEERVTQGLFLEHAFVHGAFYGTLRKDVEREIEAGHDVLLEIDIQGAHQVQSLLPDSIVIFIAPPSLDILEERLRQRGTEVEEKIQLRLENAKNEMAQASDCDHIIVNDVLERAIEELRNIILSYR